MTAWTTDVGLEQEPACFWREIGTHDPGTDEAAIASDELFDLLRLLLARGAPATALRPDLQLAALLGFCRANLCDPDLSPQMVATHFGISVRTLHLRFAQLGQTFGRWVLRQRLEICRAALRDPTHRSAGIAEIAYRCGFNDLSHFCKVFRLRFGATPRECRNGA
jgi:AraC family transcriptional regulator, positive regulator of tynA and feaB